MKISEAAEMTGLDISTIRFYERKGLITPSRAEGSTYRSYTDEDVCRIKQIILYRKMDLSIEMIGHLLEKPGDLQDTLRTQETKLLTERERLDGALDLCRKMIEGQASGELDMNYYMNYVSKEEKNGRKYPTAMEVLDDLALNSGIEYPLLSPLLVSHKWLRHLTGIVVFLILAVFPPIILIEKIMEWRTGQATPQALVFWIFYLFICWAVFIRIIRNR